MNPGLSDQVLITPREHIENCAVEGGKAHRNRRSGQDRSASPTTIRSSSMDLQIEQASLVNAARSPGSSSDESPAHDGNTGPGRIPMTMALRGASKSGDSSEEVDADEFYPIPLLHKIHVRIEETGHQFTLQVSNTSVTVLSNYFMPLPVGVPSKRRVLHVSRVGSIEHSRPIPNLDIPVAELVPDEDGIRRLILRHD